MTIEQISLMVALLALMAIVPALVAVVALALSVRSYERLYRLVQALLVGLLSEVTPEEGGEALLREAVDAGLVRPRGTSGPHGSPTIDDIGRTR